MAQQFTAAITGLFSRQALAAEGDADMETIFPASSQGLSVNFQKLGVPHSCASFAQEWEPH
jgi:hypothetical protein